jgi:hypothetical protein
MTPKEQAKFQLAAIREMVKELEDSDNLKDYNEALNRIQKNPLDILVRSCWTEPGYQLDPGDFQIILHTSGALVRIYGNLDSNYTPINAWLEYQDWGASWMEYYEDSASEVLLEYARQFYYGR